MSISLQKTRDGYESFRFYKKIKNIIFNVGVSVDKYGKEKALQHVKELKAIAIDNSLPITTRKRLFKERREEIKCQK